MSASKNNRMNSNFGIAFFLAGACHTPDAAYALLLELKEDREMALSQIRAGRFRVAAKLAKSKYYIEHGTEWEKLEAEAEKAKIEDDEQFSEKNIKAAEEELAFINACIERVQPHRAYAHLPDNEAHQAMQREEWKREFIWRAENFYLTSGMIPPQEFESMRKHPDFQADILPAMENIKLLMSQGKPVQEVYAALADRRNDLPKMLGLNDTFLQIQDQSANSN